MEQVGFRLAIYFIFISFYFYFVSHRLVYIHAGLFILVYSILPMLPIACFLAYISLLLSNRVVLTHGMLVCVIRTT